MTWTPRKLLIVAASRKITSDNKDHAHRVIEEVYREWAWGKVNERSRKYYDQVSDRGLERLITDTIKESKWQLRRRISQQD